MREFSVSASVPATPTAVLDFLADLTRHRGLHPFLVVADVVAEGEGWREWDVLERPGVGPVRYPVRFRARVERPDQTTVLTRVRLRPGVRLDSVTRAVPAPHGSRVSEQTSVSAPRPLLGYVASQAARAHRRVFAALPAAVSGTVPGPTPE